MHISKRFAFHPMSLRIAPLQGLRNIWRAITQGVALGYHIAGLQPSGFKGEFGTFLTGKIVA